MVKGKTLVEAAEISNKAVAEALGGLPPNKMHCSNLAADALHLAIQDYLIKSGREAEVAQDPHVPPKRARALVALSGGVDSAVAALRLIDEGRTLETATVRLWPGGDRRSCCSPGALQRARQTAAWLGLPHHFVDREAEFEAEVVAPFIAAYLDGETPNPCVACNPRRLAALVGLADELGLARVATGHYARLVWRAGEPYIARGTDPVKDQSYMLWAVPPEVLARLEFPLGETTKSATRAAAEAAGLPVASEPESQEVCFAVDGYQRFLDARGVLPRAGAHRRPGRGDAGDASRALEVHDRPAARPRRVGAGAAVRARAAGGHERGGRRPPR